LNKWKLFFAVSLASASACAQADALLKVEGPGAGLDGRALYLDGDAIGVVGDTISISSAPHRLAVDLPQGIRDIKEPRSGSMAHRWASARHRPWRYATATDSQPPLQC
jgi:hypothetical protein